MANYPQTTTSSFTGDIVLTNGGKAGIGTTTPAEKLDVKGNAVIRGENFTDFGETAKVCVGDTSHYMKAVFGGGLRIGTYQANDAIALQESTGNVGIGTTDPNVKLDVNGGIRVGYTTMLRAGVIRWDSTNGKLQVCDGSIWVNLH